MSNILNGEEFSLKLYNKFPKSYIIDDVKQDFTLKRYLEVAGVGFNYTIQDINKLLSLINPDNVDFKILPILYKQYGLDLFNGIPEEYARYLLPKLGEAWSKKGSIDIIEFITSALSGIKVNAYVEYNSDKDLFINVKFEMDYSLGSYFPDPIQFKRILDNFIPFYCDMVLMYSYFFHDTTVFNNINEDDFISISETIQDECFILYKPHLKLFEQINNMDILLNNNFILSNNLYLKYEPEIFFDKIVDYYNEYINFDVIELNNFLLRMNCNDRGILKGLEKHFIFINYSHEDYTNIFNKENFKDNIKLNVLNDNIEIASKLSYNGYMLNCSKLNSKDITNFFNGYDCIKASNNKKVVFY